MPDTPSTPSLTPHAVLKQYWGYDSFRGIQEEIIRSVLQGHDTLGLMPTGGGKSVSFQVPAMLMDGICIVVTPLIALMKDQVQNLRRRGIKALSIHSGMSRGDILVTLENCIFGNYKFLYVSPERLDTDLFRLKLQRMKVCLLTVDESHCISQWGYDFRPAYLKIAEIRDLLPGVPVLALTATATPEVVDDIQQRLHFRSKNVFRMSFERTNLAYVVRHTENKQGELLHILQRTQGSAIVYVRNRRRTREVSELLNQHGITANFYHAGLAHDLRDARQQEWLEGKARVIVATNAFGMGIDKPDVQLVLHLDLPDSLEAYFQEAGRAGRNGQKAYAVILYSPADKTLLRKRIPDTYPDKDFVREVYENLQYYYQMAMGDGKGCVREFDLEQFCRTFKYFPLPVDSALKLIAQSGYIEYTAEEESASRLMFTMRRDELYNLYETDEAMERLMHVVLRSYTGLFTDYAFISEEALALRSGLKPRQVYELLLRLSRLHIVKYIPHKRTPYIIYTRERVEASRMNIPPEVYEERKKRYQARIEAMIDYVEDNVICRSRLLLHYFGEKNEHNCGQCDTCLDLRTPDRHKQTSDEELLCRDILQLLREESEATPASLAHRLSADKDAVAEALRRLLDEGRIGRTNGLLHLPRNA